LAERVAVLLVHADDATQRWVREALPEGEFAVTVRRPTDGLHAELGALRPRVALVDAALLAGDPDLRQAVLAQDPPCLLLALVLPGASATEALERGADDAIVLPLADAALRARLLSGLRLVRRALAAHEVRGQIGPAGALGILKHCEDHRLSGRLIVEGAGRRFSAEFFGGELMGTAWQPATDGGDDLATLLSLREGCYLFVQSGVDPLAPPAGAEAASEAAAESVVALAPPAPIVTKVKGSPPGVIFEVRTSGENRPRLTISTVILRDGHELRQMETSWPHPIESDADLAQAWAQMVQQHERVMGKLREVTESLRRAPGAGGGVDGTMLGWALHFVVEQAWAELGTAVTASLLGRTQRALGLRWPHLAHFRVGEGAQVTFDLSRGPTLVADAVDAVAAWLAAFLRLAREVAPNLARLDVRQSTALMAATLEGIGFYAAVDAATARAESNAAPEATPDAARHDELPTSAEPAQPATEAAG
jgi:hypothetical protein